MRHEEQKGYIYFKREKKSTGEESNKNTKRCLEKEGVPELVSKSNWK